jgi:hypothetical protein
MPQIGTSGSMSGEGKRSDWHSLKPPRLSSTLPGAVPLERLCRDGAHPGYNGKVNAYGPGSRGPGAARVQQLRDPNAE